MRNLFLLMMGFFFLNPFSNVLNAQNNFLNFDGSNDYVTINSPSGFPLGSNARTFEAWVQVPVGASGNKSILGYGPNIARQASRFRISETRIQYGIVNTTINFDLPGSIFDNNWHHIAFVYPGGGQPISASSAYLDGVSIMSSGGSNLGGVPNTILSAATISSSGAGGHFEGNLDGLRVWTVARTQSEIQAAMSTSLSGSETGLVAYYDFNEGTCGGSNPTVTTLPDLTSNNYDGVLSNFALTGCTSNWVCGGTTCNIVDNGIVVLAVPTLGQWGLIILGLLILCLGAVYIFRNSFQKKMA